MLVKIIIVRHGNNTTASRKSSTKNENHRNIIIVVRKKPKFTLTLRLISLCSIFIFLSHGSDGCAVF